MGDSVVLSCSIEVDSFVVALSIGSVVFGSGREIGPPVDRSWSVLGVSVALVSVVKKDVVGFGWDVDIYISPLWSILLHFPI